MYYSILHKVSLEIDYMFIIILFIVPSTPVLNNCLSQRPFKYTASNACFISTKAHNNLPLSDTSTIAFKTNIASTVDMTLAKPKLSRISLFFTQPYSVGPLFDDRSKYFCETANECYRSVITYITRVVLLKH